MKGTRKRKWLSVVFALLMVFQTISLVTPPLAVHADSASDHVIINEIYGGGGRGSAPYKYNFIELYNPTADPVLLGDYRLTTYHIADGTETKTYQFDADARIEPKDYYLVKLESFGANGEDFEADASGELGNNNNTSLGNNNGQVVLSKDGAVVDAVAYGNVTAAGDDYKGEGNPAVGATNTQSIQRVDFQDTDDNSADFIKTAPTPMKSGNPTDTAPKVAKVVASPDSGAVELNSTVSLSTATVSASVYYTMDGSEPTIDSTLYTDEIVLTTLPVTIKAFAVKDGWLPSDVSTFAYTEDDSGTYESAYANGMIVLPAPITADHTDPAWFLGADGAANRAALINFCKEREIDTIYVNFFNYLYNAGGPKIYDQDIREFNAQMHEAGITVYQLSGNANWMKNDFWERSLNLVNDFNLYAEEPEQKFDGYVFNLDPKGAGVPSGWNWPDDANSVLFRDLIANVSTFKADRLEEESWGIDRLGYALLGNSPSMISAAKYALDQQDTDFIVIYAQRNKALNIINDVEEAIDHAGTQDKEVVIAVWFAEMVSQPDRTFFGKSLEDATQQFGTIESHFSDHPAYAGIAVYDYTYYSQVVDTSNPNISPVTANYDLSFPNDLIVTVDLNGSELTSISDAAGPLTPGTEYVDNGATVTIKASYLNEQEMGSLAVLTFAFSNDTTKTLTINIIDSLQEPDLQTTTGNFDKKLPNTAADYPHMADVSGSILSPDFQDISVQMILNGRELVSVTNGDYALLNPSQYSVSGSTAVIKKEYLMTLPVGVAELQFHFSDDTSKTFTVTVSDTTAANPSGSFAGITVSQETRGMYVWEGRLYLDKKAAAAAAVSESPGAVANAALNRARLIQFCIDRGIKEIYYGTMEELQAIAAGGDPTDLKTMVRAVHEAGIKIHALAGVNTWIEDHQGAVDFLNNLYAYNRSVDPIYRFDAVQYDVEAWTVKNPDSDAKWNDDPFNLVDYMEMIGKVWAVQTSYSGTDEYLPLGYAIAAWLDNNDPATGKPRIASGLNYYIQDHSDYVVIMDYQDMAFAPNAANPTGIVPWVTNEISYANATGKKVVVAVTTNPESAGTLAANTFNKDGMTKMNAQLKITESVFARNVSFAGTAVQSYRWYSNNYDSDPENNFFGVTLNNYYNKMSIGDAKQLVAAAALKDSDPQDAGVTWTVEGPDGVVSVDANGLVVALGEGIAAVRATSNANPEYYADSVFHVSEEGTSLASVSGTISLPGGRTAPASGLLLRVIARNDSDYYSTDVRIPVGESSASFTILNVQPGDGYTFNYSILPGQGYAAAGYYNGEVTSTDYNAAQEFHISSDGAAGIDLQLIALEQTDAALESTAFEFIKSSPRDVETTITLNGNILTAVLYDGEPLSGRSYRMDHSNGEFALLADYLAALPNGSAVFSLVFNGGNAAAITVSITEDEAPGTETPGTETPPQEEAPQEEPAQSPAKSSRATAIAVDEPGAVTVNVVPEVNTETGIARALLNKEDLIRSMELAAADSQGTGTIRIDLGAETEAGTFALQLPAEPLASSQNEYRLTIMTPLGDIHLPSRLFDHPGIRDEDVVELRLSLADQGGTEESRLADIGHRPIVEISMMINGERVDISHPDGPISVSIPYTPSDEEQALYEHLVVRRIDPFGNVTPVPAGKFDPDTGSLIFTTTAWGRFGIAFVNKTFEDVGGYDWARKEIEVLASRGVIEGTSSSTYDPEKPITRADFVLLLVRGLGLTAGFDDNFADVRAGDYYYEALGIAKKLGIVNGVGNGAFNPLDPITRQDMMVLVDRALRAAGKLPEVTEPGRLDAFHDQDLIADYAMSSAAALVERGIIEGSSNRIRPMANASRAEIAVLIYRITK
jgi:hypothetical protein